MDELNLDDLFQYFKQHILFMIIIFFGVLLLGGIYSLIFQKPEFTSTTSLSLAGNGGTSDKITTNDIALNSKLVATYQEIIKSNKVLDKVINNLNIKRKAQDIASKITIKSVTDSVILKITVVDNDSNMAKDIANEVATVFSSEIKSMYNISNVTILDKAEASTNISSRSFLKQMLIYIVLGIFSAVGFISIIFFFDKTIKSVEQVEEKFGMTLLGSIPDYFSKKQKKNQGVR